MSNMNSEMQTTRLPVELSLRLSFKANEVLSYLALTRTRINWVEPAEVAAEVR